MIIAEIINYLERHYPLYFQENYDNSGLIIGDKTSKISNIIISLDITEEIIDEAIENNCNLIISHHPLIFLPIKKINNSSYIDNCIIKSIKNNIAIYSIHTNFDNSIDGGNSIIAEKIGLRKYEILLPKQDVLYKLATFVPTNYAEKVRNALFIAGAGQIGNYDNCSFSSSGQGTFRASSLANPYVGEKNKLHTENETKIEIIFPKYLQNQIIQELIKIHPYEEVAYDIYPLANKYNQWGMGIIGYLQNPVESENFIENLKLQLNLKNIKISNNLDKVNKISKVAICSGSGASLIDIAKLKNADILITADTKYHDFFKLEKQIILVDIGHYESEIYIKEKIYNILQNFINEFTNKNIKFAAFLSEKEKNPIIYL